MPCGQKSKLRSREKRRQAQDQGDAMGMKLAQTTAAEEGQPPSSAASASGNSHQASSSAPKVCEAAASTSKGAADASCATAAKGALSHHVGRRNAPQSTPSAEKSQRDPLTRRVSLLLQFLLLKYKMKEPITKADLMKITTKRYKDQFSEVLRRASEHMELVFGLELKAVDSKSQTYALVSQLEITQEEILNGDCGFPKTGIIVPLLGMIYLKDNRVTWEEMWEFLNELGIYDGPHHFIFGDTKKLLTEDLLQEKYLEYRRVPKSDPPCHEFLWGSRAHTKACKKKVMEYLEKIKFINIMAFQDLYEETWGEEQERAEAASSGMGVDNPIAKGNAKSHVKGRSSRSRHST
ncbi:melanoma-associated antigen B2-like [Tenrec ecaudatus]|uniref:melanoma-associated antigen B2-like n=1 Tax=Tenrec ecaudatus TaxID=94439 RepID=UPI003F5A4678